MPQVEWLLALYFGYIAGLFHAMGPIQSWKSPNFLSKWMEAVFVSVGCAVSTTLKSLPNIVLPPLWWGVIRCCGLSFTLEKMSQYTLLGRDEKEKAGFLVFHLAFAKFGYFSFSYTVIWVYRQKSIMKELEKSFPNNFVMRPWGSFSWGHDLSISQCIRSENGYWARDCEFLSRYPPSAS